MISSLLLSINLDLPPQTTKAFSLVIENNSLSLVIDSLSFVLQEVIKSIYLTKKAHFWIAHSLILQSKKVKIDFIAGKTKKSD